MKKKLQLAIFLLFAVCAFTLQKPVLADVTGSDSFTVTIPTAAQVTFVATDDTFNSIVSSDFGQGSNNQARNANIIGDGVVASSTSYVTTNDTATVTNQQFQISATGTNGDSATITNNAGVATLTVANNGATPSVNIVMRRNGGADNNPPRLGNPAGTPVAFAVSGGLLNIATSSAVPFDGATNKAPLDMVLDLDESSLSFTADPPGTITFDLTFTVIGIN